ncbi:MAG: RNA-directed DNA polymerase, partial [Janthinobacterium lividum]
DMLDSGIVTKLISDNFSLNQGRYNASKSTLFNLPKPNFTLRYALEMSLQDRLLYQGVAAYLIQHFDACLNWKVFSHRYQSDGPSARTLFKPHVESWKGFIGGVKASLVPGTVLVTTDIANYYENIETARLADTFRTLLPELPAAPDTKSQLRDCLERLFEWLSDWSFSSVRGLPQNRDASSFLANIYMVPVDRAVIDSGNDYFRYMDDIKIVCPDLPSARRVLKLLILSLRDRGLSVNAAKTAILEANDPDVSKHLTELSPSIQALDAMWNTRSRWPILRSLPLLRKEILALIVAKQTHSKDFRFCIRRLIWLAGCKDMPVPADFFAEVSEELINNLETAPASTDEFVEYLAVAPLTDNHLELLIKYLINPNLRIYTWQDYRLWLVLLRHGKRDSRLVDAARTLITAGLDTAARAGATLYLGRFGTTSERMVAVEQFKTLTSFLGQRCAIIGIHEVSYESGIKQFVAKHVRADLKGVYAHLQQSKGLYISALEALPITKFVDQGATFAS